MSAVSDEREYQHGFADGCHAYKPGHAQPYHPDHSHGFRYETGFVDGWKYARAHAPDDRERSLIDADRQYVGAALRPDPPIGTKERDL